MSGKCILCHREMLDVIMKIDGFPIAAQHMPSKASIADDKGEPITLCQCKLCGLIQLDNNPVEYYKDVIRSGGFSKSMLESRDEQFDHFIKTCHLEGKKVIEVGCGAGEFVDVLNKFPVHAFGIEHNMQNVKRAQSRGLNVIYGFADNSTTIFSEAPYDAFVSLNFIEHQPRPNDYLQAIYENTTENAYGYITVPDSLITVNSSGYYDLVRDHIAYYTDESARLLLNINGFDIIEAGKLDSYTLFYIVKKRKIIEKDSFAHKHDILSKKIKDTIVRVKKRNGKIAIWGASHQCFALLGTSELRKFVEYVIDSAPFKQGKYTPSSHVPIVPPDYFFKHKVDCIIILAFFYEDEIAKLIRSKFGENIEVLCLHESGGLLDWTILMMNIWYGRNCYDERYVWVVIASQIYSRSKYLRGFIYLLQLLGKESASTAYTIL